MAFDKGGVMEMDGPFTAEVLVAGWATAGIAEGGQVVLVLAASKDGERMMFSMCPRLAAALNAALTQAIAMASCGEEAH